MSEVDEDQMTKDDPTYTSEEAVRDQDDSLDAQISLLESTLTESSEGLDNFLNTSNNERILSSSKNDLQPALNEDFKSGVIRSSTCHVDAKKSDLLHPCSFKIKSNPDLIKTNSSLADSEGKCHIKSDNKDPTCSDNIFECHVTCEDAIPSKPLKAWTEIGSLEKGNFAETSSNNSQDSVNEDQNVVKDESVSLKVSVPKSNVLSEETVSLDAKYRPSKPQAIVGTEDNNSNQIDKLQSFSEQLYCSTPNHLRNERENFIFEEVHLDNKFGQTTPLNKKLASEKSKHNLKRKHMQLECIEEVDEQASDLPTEKKMKHDAPNNQVNLEELPIKSEQNESCLMESEISHSIPCYEGPAKSILKKWQSSNLARSASSSYLILDECGESDVEETGFAGSQRSIEGEEIDDFEIACKSLNEELMKYSSNIENLEKIQSQDVLENQIEAADKFDLLFHELSQSYGLGDSTSLTIKNKVESSEENLSDLDKTITEHGNDKTKSDGVPNLLIKINNEQNNSSVREITEQNLDPEDKQSNFIAGSCKEIKNKEEIDRDTVLNDENKNIYKPLAFDEEAILLGEGGNERKEPYEFFEFVSENPKENEDNYNPEWQKLGKLTSDEERYKAVRDRWRSLVPPDPNRNFTVRQWRKKNNKPPLRIVNNNNHHMAFEDEEKTQLCTAVYQNKIRKLQQELKEETQKIGDKMNSKFHQLGIQQDAQQEALHRRGGTRSQLAALTLRHIADCRKWALHFEKMHQEVKFYLENKINKLKEASEEVLLFQKFYRGVGFQTDDEACLLTDEQVQELKETDEMLDKYAKFYQS